MTDGKLDFTIVKEDKTTRGIWIFCLESIMLEIGVISVNQR